MTNIEKNSVYIDGFDISIFLYNPMNIIAESTVYSVKGSHFHIRTSLCTKDLLFLTSQTNSMLILRHVTTVTSCDEMLVFLFSSFVSFYTMSTTVDFIVPFFSSGIDRPACRVFQCLCPLPSWMTEATIRLLGGRLLLAFLAARPVLLPPPNSPFPSARPAPNPYADPRVRNPPLPLPVKAWITWASAT